MSEEKDADYIVDEKEVDSMNAITEERTAYKRLNFSTINYPAASCGVLGSRPLHIVKNAILSIFLRLSVYLFIFHTLILYILTYCLLISMFTYR